MNKNSPLSACNHEFYPHANSASLSACSLGTCRCDYCRKCGQHRTSHQTPTAPSEIITEGKGIIKDILERLPKARTLRSEWGTFYDADVQFLLSRLTASEARLETKEALYNEGIERYKEIEADKAKLLADWRAMNDGLQNLGTVDLLEHRSKFSIAIFVQTILLGLSYTDSPTAHE